MATDKTFTVAGVSTLNGECKIRFANDVMRVKNLAKNGHSDIRLVEMPEAVLKTDAAKFIATLPEFADAEAQAAIAEYLAKHDKQPKVKVEVKKAVKAAVATKPAKTAKAPKVDTSKMDDNIPF
jgi:thioredoxin-related protein